MMFFTPKLNSLKLDANREFHHWHPQSERFATMSNLISAILWHWQVNQVVIRREFYFSGGRKTNVYYFELQRYRKHMTMPVIESPPAINLIRTEKFEVIPYEKTYEAEIPSQMALVQ